MKNLGKKSAMYPTSSPMDSKDHVHYSQITVPLDILDGEDVEIDEDITITVSGKVKAIRKDQYSEDITIEIRKGEVTEENDNQKEDKSEGEGTLLGKAQ